MVIAGLLKLDSAHGLPGKLVKMQNQIQQFWWGWGVQSLHFKKQPGGGDADAVGCLGSKSSKC